MFLVFQLNKFYKLILIASLLVHIAHMFTYYYPDCVRELKAETNKHIIREVLIICHCFDQ